MATFSRRQLIKTGAGIYVVSGLPRWSAAHAAPGKDPHFFLMVTCSGGIDATSMFDARELVLTDKGLVFNPLYKVGGGKTPLTDAKPFLIKDDDGRQTLHTKTVEPLLKYRSDFSILNGVMMAHDLDGHGQNMYYVYCNNSSRNNSFLPLIGKSLGLPLDCVHIGPWEGDGNIAPLNFSGSVQLDYGSSGRLAKDFNAGRQLNNADPVNAFIRARLAANAGGKGLFSTGARKLGEGLDRAPGLQTAMASLKDAGGSSSDQVLGSVQLAHNFFESGVTGAVSIMIDKDPLADVHSSSSAIDQPAIIGQYVKELGSVFEYLTTTQYKDTGKRLLDVTTVLITSEFSRTYRQEGSKIEQTGTDHNPLTNSMLLAGKGIKGGQIFGASDLTAVGADDKFTGYSDAHKSKDPALKKPMGLPFDFDKCDVRTDLPKKFDSADYLNYQSVVNSLLTIFKIDSRELVRIPSGTQVAPVIKKLFVSTLALFALSSIFGCKFREPKSSLRAEEELSDSAWLAKASRKLRFGATLDAEDQKRFAGMPKAQVVEAMMRDTRFADTVLDFNLFFVGQSINQLKTAYRPPNAPDYSGMYQYDPQIFELPQTIAGARAVMDGGDYFEFMSATPTVYVNPGKTLSDVQAAAMKLAVESSKKSFDAALAVIEDEKGCSKVAQLASDLQYDQNLGQYFDRAFIVKFASTWLVKIRGYTCEKNAPSGTTAKAMLTEARDTFFTILEEQKSKAGSVRSLGDLVKISYRPIAGLPPLSHAFTEKGTWKRLRNSSTNYNRKRSAYMLRTYFCDDLTPLNIPDSKTHVEGKHAQDPGCRACHYKLDPMGGLFRFYGAQGRQYRDGKTLIFDDNKSVSGKDLTDYLATWEENGKLEVGYYVGQGQPHPQWKGTDLDDVFPFLQQSEDVRRCLVRRMVEYVLGPEQVYDGGWIDELSAKLRPGPKSGEGVKAIFGALVLSNTFKQSDPSAGECYDFAKGSSAASGPKIPCEVAHIIRTKCESCHNSDEASGNLNLADWKMQSDGKYGFEHKDGDDKQLPRKDSFTKMMRLITAPGPDEELMPMAGELSSDQKQALYGWLQRSIEN